MAGSSPDGEVDGSSPHDEVAGSSLAGSSPATEVAGSSPHGEVAGSSPDRTFVVGVHPGAGRTLIGSGELMGV